MAMSTVLSTLSASDLDEPSGESGVADGTVIGLLATGHCWLASTSIQWRSVSDAFSTVGSFGTDPV